MHITYRLQDCCVCNCAQVIHMQAFRLWFSALYVLCCAYYIKVTGLLCVRRSFTCKLSDFGLVHFMSSAVGDASGSAPLKQSDYARSGEAEF